MDKRKLFIAANWKMNPIPNGALDDDSPFRKTSDVDIAVFPTFVDLERCIAAKLPVGAQCGHPSEHGAHTGDVSLSMLNTLGCQYVLCGHSERRQHHGETDEDVAEQTAAAVDVGLHPIVCVGETLEERETGQAEEVVGRQVGVVLEKISEKRIENSEKYKMTIAYEPVWAIGTGKTATPEEAQAMHKFIRKKLSIINYQLSIIYGGSMKPANAESLLSQPDIDGGLIGGASLKKESFAEIVQIAQNL